MKVLQINAIYGTKSTGTIVKEIQQISVLNGIDSYVAYSTSPLGKYEVPYGYKIGGLFSQKCHALLSRISGKQAYFSYFATWKFLRWINNLKPDVIHLHNLHSNYINLNLLLGYLAKKRIPTIITMHDCWYFTGGCFHYTSVECDRWQYVCGSCPKRFQDTPAYIHDASSKILEDRVRYLSRIPQLVLVGCSEWIINQVRLSRLKDCCTSLFIYNGFDLEIFKPMKSDFKERMGLMDKKIILGPATKWLSRENRSALDYFSGNMPSNTILLLFGCDEREHRYPNVIFYDYVNTVQEMVELYSSANIMVNCSREDTLSSLNIESQACGTPVVTYDATGSAETVDGICGFAIKTGDYRELFRSAMKVLSLDKDLVSSSCRDFVKSKFEKNSNYQKYIDLYKSF